MIVKPTRGQIEDLLGEIRKRLDKNERVLITTLTKKMSEQLSDYLNGYNIRSRYLHSEISTIERVEILRDLRLGNFDVLVGVNLLREGLDLPEVSLVVIMDADKEGFLRSYKSLIQVSGRAARHISGKVILYADRMTNSMNLAMTETNRRRKLQLEYNKVHNIIPKTIVKSVDDILKTTGIVGLKKSEEVIVDYHTPGYLKQLPEESKIDELMRLMKQASKDLNFEYAAFLRDEIKEIEKKLPTKVLNKSKRKPKSNRFGR
jgi:excinuclease ABC subunit B